MPGSNNFEPMQVDAEDGNDNSAAVAGSSGGGGGGHGAPDTTFALAPIPGPSIARSSSSAAAANPEQDILWHHGGGPGGIDGVQAVNIPVVNNPSIDLETYVQGLTAENSHLR